MNFKEYHAHIYYDESTHEKALEVIERARQVEFFSVGRAHEKLVGPHPRWSCQLLFSNDDLPKAMPWILENREGLTIFMHPDTGNDYIDHTDHTIWMGEMLELDTSRFKK
ncbi:DOPA 4,5-dioxygenase family protein [Halobacteriovorax sp. JY17]|uniref:DOPA 4,5-dioxygenase family protein n=1 Tax=Halobacteriovorax sp. JY17 TaxID=2014617 RepID=UPI000C3E7A12|nr:DOPA 4,5-dioxygenase family protein [Halobacteriovorax sp. JY17]PIK15225.1 MAG: 4,5-dioxygenase [Halobacteriovorax sp. JY17]